MRHTLRILVLVAACALFAPAAAQAQPIYRPYYPPAPTATPAIRVAPNVFVFPQVATNPPYATPNYGYGYAPGGLYGSAVYNPGVLQNSYSPWGSSYYVNPNFYPWFQFR